MKLPPAVYQLRWLTLCAPLLLLTAVWYGPLNITPQETKLRLEVGQPIPGDLEFHEKRNYTRYNLRRDTNTLNSEELQLLAERYHQNIDVILNANNQRGAQSLKGDEHRQIKIPLQ